MEVDENDFKQLIGLLQQLVQKTAEPTASKNTHTDQDRATDNDQDENEEDEEEFSAPKKRRGPVGSNSTPKKKKKKFVNKFLNMKEATMHKDDSVIDKKLNRLPPTQRTRNFEYVKVKCRVCGKEENVIPALAEVRDRYKCNKCSTSPG